LIAGICERNRAEAAESFLAVDRAPGFFEGLAALARHHLLERPEEEAALCAEIMAESRRNPEIARLHTELERDIKSRLIDMLRRAAGRGEISAAVDLDGAAAGAQTNVVACANRAGSIALFAGLAGDATLGSIAANVPTRAAAPADGCPAGFAFVAVFTNATLPESAESADTALATATALRADLTDISATKNSSPLVELWVDSVEPILLLTDPPDICGSVHQTSSVYISTETVTSTAPNVTLELRNDTSLQTFDSTTFTTMTFPFVVFAQGQTFLSGVARDDAGNASSMRPDPCVVTVAP
jgi:hypothetical protein